VNNQPFYIHGASFCLRLWINSSFGDRVNVRPVNGRMYCSYKVNFDINILELYSDEFRSTHWIETKRNVTTYQSHSPGSLYNIKLMRLLAANNATRRVLTITTITATPIVVRTRTRAFTSTMAAAAARSRMQTWFPGTKAPLVIGAPMADVTNPRLASEVVRAGGLGAYYTYLFIRPTPVSLLFHTFLVPMLCVLFIHRHI